MARWTFNRFASSQWAAVPPVTTGDLSGKTVMIIGGNAGIGFEAAKHYSMMNPGKLILACRNEERASAALSKLKEETGFDRIESRLVDLARFSSVVDFAKKINEEEERLDTLVENAGILPPLEYTPTEDGWESALQVNHIASSLLSILLLPKMIHTAERFETRPCIVLVGSDVHMVTKFDKGFLEGPNPLKALGSSGYCTPEALKKRYAESKLLNLLFVRALNDRLTNSSIIVTCINPGFCYSELRKPETMASILDEFKNWAREVLFAHTAEEGSRQIIFASVGDEEHLNALRGGYISNNEVAEPSDFVISEEGRDAQEKLWVDLIEELTAIDPQVQEVSTRFLTDPVNLE